MAVYIGHDECQVIYVARNGQQRRVSSVWVGDQKVFPPVSRQEIHVFTRDTQGYSREDYDTGSVFEVPVPWWAASMDVVLLGAGEKGQDGTKSFSGGSDGAGGKSGAWVVSTHAMTTSGVASIVVGKGTSTTPFDTYVHIPGEGEDSILVAASQGTRTPNNGSTGGSVTPLTRTEFMQSHTGGMGGTRNNPGQHPGGGGGGGQGSNLVGNPKSGQPGGDGYVWLRFRSETLIIGSDGVLRVGVQAGPAYEAVRAWAVSIGKTHQTITEITVPLGVVGPSLVSLFNGCNTLASVPDMDTSQVTNMQSMFSNCWSLTSVPALNTGQVANMQSMFNRCNTLASVPDMDTSQVTNMYYMFSNCWSLTSVPALDTSQVTDMRYMFNGCRALTSVPALDTSQVTNVGSMFVGCSSLESVTLPGMGSAFTTSQTMDMKSTKLNAAAANALMQSLGTVPAAANGTKLELPATATGADTSIATAKNWTVTIG